MRLKQLSSLMAVVVVGFGFYAMGADDDQLQKVGHKDFRGGRGD